MANPGGLSCKEIIELVTDYVEGTLPSDVVARFEEHLRGCEGCRHYVEQMRLTIQLVGSVEEEDLSDEAKDHLLRAFRHWKESP
jgi:predicted anti-sigma-YlaC factor YlaD